MTDDRTTLRGTRQTGLGRRRGTPAPASVLALAVAWSRDEPRRLGEVALIDGDRVLGRGKARPEDGVQRAELGRQRPGTFEATGPIESLRVSRVQLRLSPRGERLAVESVGSCALLVNGARVDRTEVSAGDTIELERELLFVVTRRARAMPALRAYPAGASFAFGEADPFGFVGESPAMWQLRERLAFAAKSGAPTLLHGESGTGKELAARALHALSARAARPFVSRNAATLPEGLVDAELFGNVKNYPNPGMNERAGLLGEAEGGTLFVDEIGEISTNLQAHLLRVLDRDGEYQRLGDARARRADVRFVAATNRDLEELKHDLAARFTARVELPSLADRREDVPLLARHTLRGAGAPALDVTLVERLVRHRYRHHARELDRILWQALADLEGDRVALSPAVSRLLDVDEREEDGPSREGAEPTREAPGCHAGNGYGQAIRLTAEVFQQHGDGEERDQSARGGECPGGKSGDAGVADAG